MRGNHPLGGIRDAITMCAASHELADSTTSSFLHRNTLGGGAFAKGCLLIVGQSKRHRHRWRVSE